MKIKNKIPNVVIPTIRDEQFKTFINAWKEELVGCHLIVVEDREKKTEPIRFILQESGLSYQHFDWKDIDKELGSDAWIIPRQTDCVRSFGYLKALENDPLFIITLDDDIKPQENHIITFANNLLYETLPEHDFYNTLRNHKFPRGTYQSKNKGCDVVHGCWVGSPDLSAEEQTKEAWVSTPESFNVGLVPKGAYVSLCGMNLAWRPEITRYMYFGLQGKEYPIDRCGDIWCGYLLCNKGVKIYTGYPFCKHERASNIWSNTAKELNAKSMSHDFLDWIEGDDIWTHNEYWDKLKDAYKVWERLVNERSNNNSNM
jgi:hypothetical protein